MNRRLRIDELADLARKKYPDKARDYYWIERYAKMASRIIGWEKDYGGFQVSHKPQGSEGLDVVLLFVNEEDRTTRSPAKKQAIQDWRTEGELAYQSEKVSQAEAPAKG